MDILKRIIVICTIAAVFLGIGILIISYMANFTNEKQRRIVRMTGWFVILVNIISATANVVD